MGGVRCQFMINNMAIYNKRIRNELLLFHLFYETFIVGFYPVADETESLNLTAVFKRRLVTKADLKDRPQSHSCLGTQFTPYISVLIKGIDVSVLGQ